MVRHIRLALCLFVGVLLLAGCGNVKAPETVEQDCIVIDKNGEITAYIVRNFYKEFYKLSELREMAYKEAEEFNKEHGGQNVMIDSMEEFGDEDKKIRVACKYLTADSYNGFNEGKIFYGVVAKGWSDAGFIFGSDIDFSSVKSLKDGSGFDRTALSDRHVIITNEKTNIYCPYDIAFVSGGVKVDGGNVADTTSSEKLSIIVLKK